jgi:RHS repeat-associated protein
VKYYLADRLSTRMTTSSTGSVLGTQGHLPFGEEAGTFGGVEKHQFTNYERDDESGTDYGVNRQYSHETGRFMRPDPVAGSAGNPQSLNRYGYSLNDPVNLTDPLGLFTCYVDNIATDCSSAFSLVRGGFADIVL